jgi:hypothetical protein
MKVFIVGMVALIIALISNISDAWHGGCYGPPNIQCDASKPYCSCNDQRECMWACELIPIHGR